MNMADTQSSEFMYKRIVNPGLDKLGHANRLGIRLKSSWMPKKSLRVHSQQPPKSSGHNRRQMTPNRLASAQRPASVAEMNGSPPKYIQDMVIPIASNVQTDEVNVQRSLSPRSFCSTTKFKQVPLPTVSPRSSAKTPNYRPMSICSERYLTSVTPESRVASDSSRWNCSEQSVRLEAGQKALDRCRTLKRTSEMKAYRVDRLYYMSGATCRLNQRYMFDENELKMLKESSRSTKTPRLAGEYRPIVEEGGKYQTPGDHHSQLNRESEEGGDHTFITQPSPSKEHSTKDPASRPRSSRSVASSHSGIFQNEDEAKSKKRIGSSKSVTFSESDPEHKMVEKTAVADSGKESGVESCVDETKTEDESKINDDGIQENDDVNVESGIDNNDIEDTGAVQESDDIQNGDSVENDETVDNDINENVDVDQTALDGDGKDIDEYLDSVDTEVNGENNVDDSENIDQSENCDIENGVDESGAAISMNGNFENSNGDVDEQQMTESKEQTTLLENEIVDNLENVDLEAGNEQLEPSQGGKEMNQEILEEGKIGYEDSGSIDETQANLGDSVKADDDLDENANVQTEDGAVGTEEPHGDSTETNAADVDAILKMI